MISVSYDFMACRFNNVGFLHKESLDRSLNGYRLFTVYWINELIVVRDIAPLGCFDLHLHGDSTDLVSQRH